MLNFRYLIYFFLLGLSFSAYSDCNNCNCDNCCGGMGGIQYCDSSAGRYVCKNGEYSVCYCTRHAVMNLQKIEGCCLWQGGVLQVNDIGMVICRNGSISELCSLNYQGN